MKSVNIKTLLFAIIITLTVFNISSAYEPQHDLEYLSKQVSIDESVELLTEFGWALLYDNQISRAIPTFELALEKEPHNVDILEGLAICYQMLGDYKKSVKYFTDMLRFHKDDPRAEVYLNTVYILSEDAGVKEELQFLLEDLLETGKANPNFNTIARIFLSSLLLESGDIEFAEDTFEKLGFVDDWWVIGPFSNEGKTGFDAVYPPEEIIDLDGEYEGKGFDVSWRKLPFEVPYGKISLDSLFYPRDNTTAYALTAVYSESEKVCVVRSGSSGALKVFINGEEVISNDAYRYFSYDQEVGVVRLNSGWNLVLLKTCTIDGREWDASLRFTELDGSTISDLTYSTDVADIRTARLQTYIPPPEEAWSERDRGARDIYDVLAYTTPEDTMVHIYRGLLESYYNYYDREDKKETRFFRKALELRPKWSLIHFLMGLSEEEANTARGLFERAIDLCPQFNQAKMELGRYLYDIEREKKAYRIFEEIIETKPNYLEPRQYIVKIAWENGWYPVMEREIGELLKREDNYIFAYLDKALLATERGIDEKAIEMYRNVLDMNFEAYYAREQLVELLSYLGEVGLASGVLSEYIRAHPYDVYTRVQLLKLYRNFELFDEAMEVADEILEINPRHYEALSWRGLVLHRLGRDEEAKASFERAIEYKRNYPWLNEYMEFLEPERRAYYEEFRYNVYDLIGNMEMDFSEYYQSDAVYLLNQEIRRVWENGTSSYTTHYIIKILTEKGVENFKYLPVLYSPELEDVTILNARVIQPGGEEIVSTNITEYSTSDEYTRLYYDEMAKFVELEGVEVGSIIDFEYIVDQTEENLFADYFGERFFFGDEEPIKKAEYILIVPESRKFYFNDFNRKLITREVFPSDDTIVYTFDASNLDGLVTEPNMPPLIELIPQVEITTFKSWDELAQWYWGLIKDQFRSNYKIKELVRELTLDKKTTMEKVRSIYNHIVKKIRYVGLEFGIGGFKPRKPEVCYNTKYGDCKDKGTLLITMLEEIGVEAKPVLVRMRSSGLKDMELPILSNFNHFIVLAEVEGEEIFLDPTAEFAGIGEFPFQDQGIEAFVVEEDGGYFKTTPLKGPEENYTDVNMKVWINEDGSAKATRTVEYGASDSPYQRSRFINKIERKSIIEEYWNALYPGTSVSDVSFENIENYDENVEISYMLKVPDFVREVDDVYYLPTRIPTDDLLNTFASRSSRVYTLDIGSPFKITSYIEYIIPDEFEVFTDRFPINIEYDSKFGKVIAKYSREGDRLIADIEVNIFPTRVSPEDYGAFRQFLNEVDSRSKEEFILMKR